MNLHINISTDPTDPKTAAEQVADALAALGFVRRDVSVLSADTPPASFLKSLWECVGPGCDVKPDATQIDEPSDTVGIIRGATAAEAAAPKRERGKPGPGRKRRSAEEVAEDEAAHAADVHAAATAEAKFTPAEDQAHLTSLDEQTAAQSAISTGEERVSPEDAPEVVAQDAADEAAEAEGGAIVDMLTLDNLRDAANGYVARYGMAATQADILLVLKNALGPVPEGAMKVDGVTPATDWRLGLVPDDQEMLRKAIAGIQAATAGNPYGRAVVA